MNAEQLARTLGFKRAGNQWLGCCVAHDDRNPSMIVFDGDTSMQVRCLAGCEPVEIIEVLRERGVWQGNSDNGYPSSEDETRRQQRDQEIFERDQKRRPPGPSPVG